MHTRIEIVDEHLGRAFTAGALDRGLGGRLGVAVLRDGLRVTVTPHDPASSRPWLDMDGRSWLT
jgi:predicted Zn-dependent protease